METRKKLGINARQPVFCTFSKVAGKPKVGPIQPRYVQLMLKRLAGRAGIATDPPPTKRFSACVR